MSKTDFTASERHVTSLFPIGSSFVFEGITYNVTNVGKPVRTGEAKGGEPKTDIYIAAESTTDNIEIKISYKKENADFLENKISAKRAKEIFGNDWKQIIQQCTESIKEEFEERNLIYYSKEGKTEEGCFTLGWKFEFVNKSNGGLSGEVNLTKEQKEDVYSGTNLENDFKNAKVNGEVIENSGVANYVLILDSDSLSTAQDVIDNMESIHEYASQDTTKIYFACKALNYRSLYNHGAGKYDGDRPLSVQVIWSVVGRKLHSELQFNKPLECNGNETAKKLKDALKELHVTNTSDLDTSIIDNAKHN